MSGFDACGFTEVAYPATSQVVRQQSPESSQVYAMWPQSPESSQVYAMRHSHGSHSSQPGSLLPAAMAASMPALRGAPGGAAADVLRATMALGSRPAANSTAVNKNSLLAGSSIAQLLSKVNSTLQEEEEKMAKIRARPIRPVSPLGSVIFWPRAWSGSYFCGVKFLHMRG